MGMGNIPRSSLWALVTGVAKEVDDTTEDPGSAQSSGNKRESETRNKEGAQERGVVLSKVGVGALGYMADPRVSFENMQQNWIAGHLLETRLDDVPQLNLKAALFLAASSSEA
jgi:hypothetical protein